jgi:hypothetical protein
MPEVPNAYECEYCHELMEPREEITEQWHTKWCSKCGARLYDVFIGGDPPEESSRSSSSIEYRDGCAIIAFNPSGVKRLTVTGRFNKEMVDFQELRRKED